MTRRRTPPKPVKVQDILARQRATGNVRFRHAGTAEKWTNGTYVKSDDESVTVALKNGASRDLNRGLYTIETPMGNGSWEPVE
jgi:hypothetical protein